MGARRTGLVCRSDEVRDRGCCRTSCVVGWVAPVEQHDKRVARAHEQVEERRAILVAGEEIGGAFRGGDEVPRGRGRLPREDDSVGAEHDHHTRSDTPRLSHRCDGHAAGVAFNPLGALLEAAVEPGRDHVVGDSRGFEAIRERLEIDQRA
jgi:hypothetical protein